MSERRSGRPVVLDRDGTLVVDRHYLSDPDGLEFLPGAEEGLRIMAGLGCRLIVITNQSGVGRGMFPMEALHPMNVRLEHMVAKAGARLEKIYYCPHRPEDRCLCRKPGTKLLLQAAAELGFEPSEAVVIGDKASDVEFGRNAGATTMLVSAATQDEQGRAAQADYVVPDLRAAAAILSQMTGR